jgi:hypothetical protein
VAAFNININVTGAEDHTKRSVEADSYKFEGDFIQFCKAAGPGRGPDLVVLTLRADQVHLIERVGD